MWGQFEPIGAPGYQIFHVCRLQLSWVVIIFSPILLDLKKGLSISRRAFVSGCLAAAAGTWVLQSDRFSARLIRGSVGDFTRDVITPIKPTPKLWNPNGITATWIGHATVLVNFYGTTILTDPVLFDRVGVDLGVAVAGRKRLVGAALQPEEFPKIDLILLSHAHMDHLDTRSLEVLDRSAQVVTAAETQDLVHECGYSRVTPLRWNQKTSIKSSSGQLEVEAFEVKHWGARWGSDTQRGYNGYVLRKDGREILFGGDTAYSGTFKNLKGRPALAVMPIGSYGSKSGNHCTPEEAVLMANECRAEYVMPIHHRTFPIGREPIHEPLERFEQAIEKERIAIREAGETWVLPV